MAVNYKQLNILIGDHFFPGSLGASYARAFESLGNVCVRFELSLTAYSTIQHPGTTRLTRAHCIKAMNQALRKIVHETRPDLIFIIKGKELDPEALNDLRELSTAPIFNFNPDGVWSPFSSSDYIVDCAPLYDCLLTPRRWELPKLKQLGGQHVTWLPYGYDEKLHYPTTITEADRALYHAAISFIGTWAPEDRISLLSDIARYGNDLRIWGSSWEKLKPLGTLFHMLSILGLHIPKQLLGLGSPLHNHIMGYPVYGELFLKVVQASDINLAFLRKADRDDHTMRTFELPACGVFVIAERTQDHQGFFHEDIEMVFFNGDKELLEKIGFYKKRPRLRQKIARAGLERLRSSPYRYTDRAKTILSLFETIQSI